jgi:hypothetical protein
MLPRFSLKSFQPVLIFASDVEVCASDITAHLGNPCVVETLLGPTGPVQWIDQMDATKFGYPVYYTHGTLFLQGNSTLE